MLAANANSVVHCFDYVEYRWLSDLSLRNTVRIVTDAAGFLTDIICGERFLPHKPSETLKIRGRNQRNQILTLDVSTSSNLASACAPFRVKGLLFHKHVCLSRSYCISLTKQDRTAGKLKWKSTASIFSEMEKILPSEKVSISVRSNKHVRRHTHTAIFTDYYSHTVIFTVSPV